MTDYNNVLIKSEVSHTLPYKYFLRTYTIVIDTPSRDEFLYTTEEISY